MSAAERLLELADTILLPKSKLGVCDSSVTPQVVNRIALAIKLRRSSPVIQLRAVVENWDEIRIVRELY